jgi:hypothetical protein
MCINSRDWSFTFALTSRDDARRILLFLQGHIAHSGSSELVVGSLHGTPVRLIKDDEFDDRFWLRANGNRYMVEFELAADDLTEFMDAISQVINDLSM